MKIFPAHTVISKPLLILHSVRYRLHCVDSTDSEQRTHAINANVTTSVVDCPALPRERNHVLLSCHVLKDKLHIRACHHSILCSISIFFFFVLSPDKNIPKEREVKPEVVMNLLIILAVLAALSVEVVSNNMEVTLSLKAIHGFN